jgi:hypothetical protein
MSDDKAGDQVARRMSFCESHPDVSVTYDSGEMEWSASFPDGSGGIREVRSSALKNVLDKLESVIGKEQP